MGAAIQEIVPRGLFIAAATFQKQTKAPVLPLLLAIAEGGRQANSTAEEISLEMKAALSKSADSLAALSPFGLDLGLSEDTKTQYLIRDLLREPTIAAKQGASILNEAVGQRLREFQTSASLSSSADLLAERERMAALTQSTIGKAFDLYTTGDLVYRQVYDEHLLAIITTKPGSTIGTLIDANPVFAGQPCIAKLITFTQTFGWPSDSSSLTEHAQSALRTLFTDSVQSLLPTFNDSMDSLATSLSSVAGVADQVLKDFQSLRAASSQWSTVSSKAKMDNISLGGAAVSLQAAASLLSLVDSSLGRELATVGTATLAITELVSSFANVSSLGSAALGVGAAAATGGTLTAIMGLVSLFQKQGASGDNQTMLAFTQLSNQIKRLQQHMERRFDRVEGMLTEIYQSMMTQFSLLERAVKDVRQQLGDVKEELDLVDRRLSSFSTDLGAGLSSLLDDIATLHLAPCIGWKHSTKTIAMPMAQYISCMATLRSVAVDVPHVDKMEGPTFDTLQQISIRLQDRTKSPLDHFAFLLSVSVGLGYPFIEPGLLPKVQRPRRWIQAAEAYLDLAVSYPNNFRQVTAEGVTQIIESGAIIARGLSAAAQKDKAGLVIDKILRQSNMDLVQLEKLLTGFQNSLEDPYPKEGESWLSYKDKRENMPGLCRPEDPVPIDPRGLSSSSLIAQRLGLGRLRWVVEATNLGGVPDGQVKTFKILFVLYLDTTGSKDLSGLVIERRLFYTPLAVQFPRVHYQGGINPFVDVGDPKIDVFLDTQYKRAFESLKRTPTKQETDNPLSGEDVEFDMLYSESSIRFANDKETFAALLKTELSKSKYDYILTSSDTTLYSKRLEDYMTIIQEYLRLGVPTQLANSEAMQALIGGNASSLTKKGIEELQKTGADAGMLVSIGRARLEAIRKLADNSMEATRLPYQPSGLGAVQETLTKLRTLSKSQIAMGTVAF